MLSFQFCTPTVQFFIAHEEHPANQWKILKEHYSEIGGISTSQNLLEEFYGENVNFNSMDEYGSRFKSYQDQLAFTDKKLSDASLISQLLRHLAQGTSNPA